MPNNLTRIEIKLSAPDAKRIAAIAKRAGRSRKNYIEQLVLADVERDKTDKDESPRTI